MTAAAPSTPSKIIAFGEVLWDVMGDREYIGGAPFNLAAHAARCGLTAHLYSRVGTDSRGERARAELARLKVDDTFVQTDPARPTGWVDVELHDGEPTYSIGENAAWDAIEAPGEAVRSELRVARFAALVCGTLAQRSATSHDALQHLRRLLPEVPIFYDINLRAPHTPFDLVRLTLPGTTLVKTNAAEVTALAEHLYGKPLPPNEIFARLQSDYSIKLLIMTRGADGATVISADETIDVPGTPVKVASAVGAGDAFSAAFLAGWLQKKPLRQALTRATQIGAWVASQPEAIPDYPPELRAE